MTFWHFSVSFRLHLAHLPSPVIVTSLPSSAANVGTASANRANPATLAIIAILRFIIFSSVVLVLLGNGGSLNQTVNTGVLFKKDRKRRRDRRLHYAESAAQEGRKGTDR